MYVAVSLLANGPIPGDYSMFWFSAVVVEPSLTYHFTGRMHPLPGAGIQDGPVENKAYKLSGVPYVETLRWPEPEVVMRAFRDWIVNRQQAREHDRTVLVAVDGWSTAMWMNWYFHHFLGESPFDRSVLGLNTLYKGLQRSTFRSLRDLCFDKASHRPDLDVLTAAEILLYLRDDFKLEVKL